MEENRTDENSSIQLIPVKIETSKSVNENNPIVAEKENYLEEKPPELKTSESKASEKASSKANAVEKEKKPEHPKEKKALRRRSSLGSLIANAFIAPGTEDTMSPVEKRVPVRPRRCVQMKVVHPVQAARPPPPKPPKPIRYSFDLGERVAVKSCLKSSSITERNCTVPAQKSLTQKAANKIVAKYRKSGGFIDKNTPSHKTRSKLKFNNICTIRVITPRPDYNPDKLEMPHSDDEADIETNANRERLSTVDLQLTPTSQSQLVEIREGGVVQFNATMVFGDGSPLASKISSSTSETDTAVTKESETISTSSTSEVDSELKTIEKRKKSRRKSLILGSASPMKSPGKIEKPRFDDMEKSMDTVSEPPRRSRRSVRLNKQDIIEKPSEDADVVLHEREENSQKKRGIVHEDVPNEPNPKRSRRKSGFFKKDDMELVEEKTEVKEETEKLIHPFFAPKKAEEKVKDKVAEKTKKAKITLEKPEKSAQREQMKTPDEQEKVRKRTRRSSAYFGVAADKTDSSKTFDIIVIDETSKPSTSSESVSEVKAAVETTIVASSSSSSSTVSISSKLTQTSISKEVECRASPKPGKVAPIFTRSPAQVKKVSEVKESEASTSTSQTSTQSTPKSSSKLFSLFSPKPKPPTETSADLPITISDSPLAPPVPKEVFRCPKTTIGVKRKEHWGDIHPESYEFVLKMATQPSIFDDTTIDPSTEKLFNQRVFDENILNVIGINSDLTEIQSEDKNVLIMKKSEKNRIEKFPELKSESPFAVYPNSMDYLVEGAEEKEIICEWLKKWKKRVRKEREMELKREKNRRKSRGNKGRKKKDSDDDGSYDDSDDDYELEVESLENPLVLIGPTGVGKTALVRALAKQSNMRIISMGPETDRSGAEIKRQIFEALRSHRVDQQKSYALGAFYKTVGSSAFEKKDEKPKEFVQSLIVFEHVDVFFDTLDRHGLSYLLEMINEAAVPVVFTCENGWSRSIGQVALTKRPLEIRLRRNEKKIQQYVQRVIYTIRNVAISDSTIRQLSESVNHDLQALLLQASFFSLAPKKPFPLSSRHLVPDGFDVDWEKPRKGLRCNDENERLEHLMDMYSEVLPDCYIHPLYQKVHHSWDSERRGLASKQSRNFESLQNAYEALNGRYSKRDLAVEILPSLVPIDRVERKKATHNRRHLHRFKTHSDTIKTDGHALVDVVGRWGFKKELSSL